jgi:hypothetical protein
MAWKLNIIFNFEHQNRCMRAVVEQPVYTLFVLIIGCIYVEKVLFWLWKVQKGTSSLHRKMERPSNQIALGEEKFSITWTYH